MRQFGQELRPLVDLKMDNILFPLTNSSFDDPFLLKFVVILDQQQIQIDFENEGYAEF